MAPFPLRRRAVYQRDGVRLMSRLATDLARALDPCALAAESVGAFPRRLTYHAENTAKRLRAVR